MEKCCPAVESFFLRASEKAPVKPDFPRRIPDGRFSQGTIGNSVGNNPLKTNTEVEKMNKFRAVAAVAVLAAIVLALSGCEKTPTEKAADETSKAMDKIVDSAKDLGK